MLAKCDHAYLLKNPLIWATLVFLAATSCGRLLERKVKDGGLISGDPCSAPCFLGIIPGETSKSLAIEALREESIEPFCEISDVITCFRIIYIAFGTDGIVETASFHLYNDVSVRNVIEKYGEPDHVVVTAEPSVPQSQMRLFFDRIHTVLFLAYSPNDFYILSQDTLVRDVQYSDVQKYREILGYIPHVLEWKGYTTYYDPDPFGTIEQDDP